MATPQEHKAAIDAAMSEYKAAKAEAAAKVDAAKAKVSEIAEAAGKDLAEGEIRSLVGNVPVLVKRNGKVLYEVIKALDGGGS